MKRSTMIKRAAALFLCICLLMAFPVSAYAVGEGNADGGAEAGNLQDGTKENNWIPGNEGVRISVVDADTGRVMFTPFDWSRKSQENKTVTYFGMNCKLEYMAGKGLSGENGYICENHSELPVIISHTRLGNSDAEEIKAYFTDKRVVEAIATGIGIPYEELTGGSYKIVIEPVIYLTFQGIYGFWHCRNGTYVL